MKSFTRVVSHFAVTRLQGDGGFPLLFVNCAHFQSIHEANFDTSKLCTELHDIDAQEMCVRNH